MHFLLSVKTKHARCIRWLLGMRYSRPCLKLAPPKPTAPPALCFTTTHNETSQERVNPHIETLYRRQECGNWWGQCPPAGSRRGDLVDIWGQRPQTLKQYNQFENMVITVFKYNAVIVCCCPDRRFILSDAWISPLASPVPPPMVEFLCIQR